MDFTLPPEIGRSRSASATSSTAEVLPLETDPAILRRSREHPPRPAATRVRAKARAAGLWAPQMPKERGGLGLPIVGWAAFYEEANRSIFGPVCLNCQAPDDGNMIAAQQGAAERRHEGPLAAADHRRQGPLLLRDDRAAARLRLRSRRHDADAGRAAQGDRYVVSRPQMVHLGRRGGEPFHPGRAHLRRSAPRPHRLSVPSRRSGLAHRAAHSRSWGRKSMAGSASSNSTGSRSRSSTA